MIFVGSMVAGLFFLKVIAPVARLLKVPLRVPGLISKFPDSLSYILVLLMRMDPF